MRVVRSESKGPVTPKLVLICNLSPNLSDISCSDSLLPSCARATGQSAIKSRQVRVLFRDMAGAINRMMLGSKGSTNIMASDLQLTRLE